MYAGKVNSPVATLASNLSIVPAGTVETVEVSEETFFPAPPCLATIGAGNAAETVLYTDKVGNTLTIERGFEGAVGAWTIGTPIGRFFTAYDHETFKNNVSELNTIKADKDGTYPLLRAQSTTKDDVGLGNVDDIQQAPLTHVGAVGAAHGAATSINNGFMSTADKDKIDGIESGATADQTATEIKDLLVTVDGYSSGIVATDSEQVGGSKFVTSATEPVAPSENDIWIDTTT